MALATFERLTFWYGEEESPALRDVDLGLETGLTLVHGPSGGGKSTFLRCLNGLVPHFHGGRIAGRVTVAGLDVLSTPTRTLARHVGFVFQDPELQMLRGRVEQEVAFGLENIGMPRALMIDRVQEAMATAGITHLRDRTVATLSGGEKQRVAMAAALALRPRMLVLDEPASQLDPEGTRAIFGACIDLARTSAVVVSEHRSADLQPAASAQVRLDGGRASFDVAGTEGRAPLPRRDPLPGTGEVVLQLCDLVAGAGAEPVLRGASLELRAGEVVAVTGPNGAGKTTLLRAAARLLPARSGSVSRAQVPVAYLPQDPGALLHRATVLDEVGYGVGDVNELVSRAISGMGLDQQADAYPRDLSTGQRQRVAIAAVLAGTPGLALLDEPTRGMDAAAFTRLVDLIRRLSREGTAVMLATHDTELIGATATRVLQLHEGLLQEAVPFSAGVTP
jgi:energy-coupling factor transporter ATP-binding protein EcfA2